MEDCLNYNSNQLIQLSICMFLFIKEDKYLNTNFDLSYMVKVLSNYIHVGHIKGLYSLSIIYCHYI